MFGRAKCAKRHRQGGGGVAGALPCNQSINKSMNRSIDYSILYCAWRQRKIPHAC